jgi:hypothetical protein
VWIPCGLCCSCQWGENVSLNCSHQGPVVHPPDDIWMCRVMVEWYRWEDWRTQRKTCPSATLSTTNPTWTEPGANSGLRSDRLATNHLNQGTAILWTVVMLFWQLTSEFLTQLSDLSVKTLQSLTNYMVHCLPCKGSNYTAEDLVTID